MKVGTTTTAATTQGFVAARDRDFRGADDRYRAGHCLAPDALAAGPGLGDRGT